MSKKKNKQKNIVTTEYRFGLGRLFLGLLVVIVGAAYLAEYFGLSNVNVGFIVGHFWSLLVIWFGFLLLNSRDRSIYQIGIVLSFVIAAIIGYFVFSPTGEFSLAHRETFQIEKMPAAEAAEIHIGSGAMILSAEGGPVSLVEGKFGSELWSVSTSSSFSAGLQKVRLNAESLSRLERLSSLGRGPSDLRMEITETMPVSLFVSSAASDIDLDLSTIDARNVTIDTGASRLRLQLSTVATTSAIKISSGASAITVAIPKEIGARLVFKSALTAYDVGDLVKVSGQANLPGESVYQTKNYSTSEKKANVVIDSGVGRVEIE